MTITCDTIGQLQVKLCHEITNCPSEHLVCLCVLGVWLQEGVWQGEVMGCDGGVQGCVAGVYDRVLQG